MRWNLLISVFVVVSLIGCTPTIDTSSEERMEESVEKIRLETMRAEFGE